ADAELLAQIALADGRLAEPNLRHERIVVFFLQVDDDFDAVALDGVAQAGGGELAAAVEAAVADDAEAFAVGVGGAVVCRRPAEDDERDADPQSPSPPRGHSEFPPISRTGLCRSGELPSISTKLAKMLDKGLPWSR